MMRAGLLIVVGLLLAAFVAGNWGAFTTSTVLTLGAFDFTAPLGLLLLVALGIVTLSFLAMMALWQGRILAESRRHAREIAEQRARAENVEASRLMALRGTLAEDLKRIEARVEAAEASLRSDLHDGLNSLAAMVGEMDERLAADAPAESPMDVPPRGSRH